MKIKTILHIVLMIGASGIAFAQDTLSPKVDNDEYRIRSVINIDFFNTKEVGLIAKSKKLQEISYAFNELSVGFYSPIFSHTSVNVESNKRYKSHFTLLATGSFVKSKPKLDLFSTERNFLRISTGLRALYFNGNKSLWMVNVSPFVAEDNFTIKNAKWRMYGDFIYSRVVNKLFSYKLGMSYTYRFGEGGLLPVLGVRIGDYNKHFLSIQFPKNISYNVKLSPKIYIGAFIRPNGGIYRFKLNKPDQSVLQNHLESKTLVLTRSDYLSGLMLNMAVSPSFYLCVNSGVAYNRSVGLSVNNNFNGKGGVTAFRGTGRTLNVENSVFFNISLTYYFGKPTYSSGFSPLLEMKALNSTHDAGDLNNSNDAITNDMNQVTEKDIRKKEAQSSLEDNYKDIQDFLMEE